mgnify:CR=1 FL=1
MLYASTRATLKKSLGDSFFVDELYGTLKAEFTMEGYQKHRKSMTSAPALTEREEEIQRMRKEEVIFSSHSIKTKIQKEK